MHLLLTRLTWCTASDSAEDENVPVPWLCWRRPESPAER